MTRNQRIYVAKPASFAIESLDAQVDALIRAARTGSSNEMLLTIKALVPGFAGSPSSHAVAAVPLTRGETTTGSAKQAA